jgi:hypothetical protein
MYYSVHRPDQVSISSEYHVERVCFSCSHRLIMLVAFFLLMSGKTIVAELAMLRLFSMYPGQKVSRTHTTRIHCKRIPAFTLTGTQQPTPTVHRT